MGRAFGFISLLAVLVVGMYLYTRQVQTASSGVAAGAADPKTAINITGVRQDLLRFVRAEQQHMASDGHYVSLSEMRSTDTGIPADARGPYAYSIDTSESSFTVTATYQGTPPAGIPRVLSVGPEGTISQSGE